MSPPAAGFEHLDAPRSQRLAGRQDVGPAPVSPDTERQDRRMLDEQEQIVDGPGAPFFDQRALQRQRVGIRHTAQPPDVELSGHASEGSQFSMVCFTCDMNSSATAPSMIRWS